MDHSNVGSGIKLDLCILPCDTLGAISLVYGLLNGPAGDAVGRVYCGVLDQSYPDFTALRQHNKVSIFEYSERNFDEVESRFQQADSVLLCPLHVAPNGGGEDGRIKSNWDHSVPGSSDLPRTPEYDTKAGRACHHQYVYQDHGYNWILRLWELYLTTARRVGVRSLCMQSLLNVPCLTGSLCRTIARMEDMFLQCVLPPSLPSGRPPGACEPAPSPRLRGFVLRTAPAMEGLKALFRDCQDGLRLGLPIDQGQCAPVALEDVALVWVRLVQHQYHHANHRPDDPVEAAALELLLRRTTVNTSKFTLTHRRGLLHLPGHQRVSGPGVAEEASKALDRPVAYERISFSEFDRLLREQCGYRGEEVYYVVEMIRNIEAGQFDEVKGDLEKITGREPLTLSAFFLRHSDTL
ncbi:hypothetical protein IWQ60_011470 [Tieghemiomyces parasiticus]|uniref:Uncharacterized protein n=1 Tax=Tieghemiomyces parasiticus TaxID=78921 RepID=A0A9W7ZMW1_9FUNG|nr:hypothetical protein IWQ60_011470 [Tieghemiomyces parasiticus]